MAEGQGYSYILVRYTPDSEVEVSNSRRKLLLFQYEPLYRVLIPSTAYSMCRWHIS